MAQGSFTNILPDPNNAYNDAGQAAGSTKGAGFSSVKLSSQHEIMQGRTNSGRLITRDNSHHKFNVDISYNPMTREDFEPVYSFLLQKRGFLKPFFVSLPQYKEPRDSTFSASAHTDTLSPTADHAAGLTNMLVTSSNYLSATHGKPRPGDLFTINDTNDSNHKKAYQVTRVEDNSDYESGQPTTAQVRVHFMPALQRAVKGSTSTLTFANPLLRVVIKNDISEYSLGSNGLYEFSLKLEEAQN